MAYRIILKISLYLWNNVPVFGRHWKRICFLSNAPNTYGMFHMISKSLATFIQSSTKDGGRR